MRNAGRFTCPLPRQEVQMKTESPSPDKRTTAPKLIEIRCPFCVDAGRNAILGKVLKRRFNVLVQSAAQRDGLEAILDIIYYCRHCDVNFVYGVISVGTPQGEA